MRLRFGPVILGSLALASGLATTGCPTTNRCSALPCPAQETCDPADGLCKCGGANVSQGIVCAANEFCDATRQVCVVDLCRMKTCSGGNECDPLDGICKCSGKICADGICDSTSHLCGVGPACIGVICGSGLTCDPIDQKCKCHGVTCAADEICLSVDAGGCQPDLCHGVHCAGADEGIACIQGVCRCGRGNGDVTVDDPVCSRIQHCQDGMCTTILGCDSVPPCHDNELCNPLDLKCHCGSRSGPICQPGVPCESVSTFNEDGGAGTDGGPFFYCVVGNDCSQTACTGGQICDPNQSFNCVCETAPGLGGPSCNQTEYCLALDSTRPPACLPICNVYAPQDCQIADAGPLNCYAEIEGGAAVCETPNPHALGFPGDPCGVNADCGPGLGCWTHAPVNNGDAGPIVSTCASYCDAPTISMQNTAFPCIPPSFCTPVAQVQGPSQILQIGFCQ